MKDEKYLQEVAKAIIVRKVGGKLMNPPALWKHPEEKAMGISIDGGFGILVDEDLNIFQVENFNVIKKNTVDSDWRSYEKFSLTGVKKELPSGALKKKNATLAELVSEAGRKIWINEKYLKYFNYHADFYQKRDGSMIYVSDAMYEGGVPILTAVVMPVRCSE